MSYKTFKGENINLYKYEGEKTILLTKSGDLELATINKSLLAADGTYNFYYKMYW